MKSTIAKMKGLLEGFKTRFEHPEKNSKLEDRPMETIKSEKQKEKRLKKSEQNLWYSIKWTNIHIV